MCVCGVSSTPFFNRICSVQADICTCCVQCHPRTFPGLGHLTRLLLLDLSVSFSTFLNFRGSLAFHLGELTRCCLPSFTTPSYAHHCSDISSSIRCVFLFHAPEKGIIFSCHFSSPPRLFASLDTLPLSRHFPPVRQMYSSVRPRMASWTSLLALSPLTRTHHQSGRA